MKIAAVFMCFALVLITHAAPARAGSEDDCIEAQEHLKLAKDDAVMAANNYASCLGEHNGDDDCSTEKSAVDLAHDEVESAQIEAGSDCS